MEELWSSRRFWQVYGKNAAPLEESHRGNYEISLGEIMRQKYLSITTRESNP